MPCDPADHDGRELLASGAWNEDTTLTIRGGQAMHFRVTNVNLLGTQLSITSPDNPGGATLLIPPLPGAAIDFPVFTRFGDEPIDWHFDISFEGDAYAVTWCLYSGWVPGIPTVEGVDPPSGVTGADVVITGPGMGGATDVRFGAVQAVITHIADRQVAATAPTGSGSVDITVTTPAGTSAVTPADQFTYLPVPTIAAVLPSQGVPGTPVTITGSGFNGTTDVSFGPQSVNPSDASDTEITVTAPTGSGSVDIMVTTPGGTSALTPADQFTYTSVPTITGVSPGQGAAGETVTISGTAFTGFTNISFGPVSVNPDDASDTTLTVTAPGGSGTVDITVTTPAGTSAAVQADQFTYTSDLIAAPQAANLGHNPQGRKS